MNLKLEICKYIKHKVVLANVSSHYLNFQRLNALQYCDSLLKLFKYQGQYLTERDIATFILQNKQHLQMILPAEANKSYKSSFIKYNELIEYSTNLFKPNAPKTI